MSVSRNLSSRESAHRLRRAARILRDGGVLAHPTEGVWGLTCDPLQSDAVLRVLALKQRDAARGLIVIGASAEHLAPFVDPDALDDWQRAAASWPGPTTWLLPARAETPWWLTGEHSTIALRQTAHSGSADLCNAFGGPLVSTSANVSGRPPVRSAWQARARFGDGLDFVLHGRHDHPGVPSQIRDAASGRILRG
ncbi:L-threonylcarbamoyladenylate synthase [Salinisphaera aquimarina]|uniref:Threonylcarbamoyl-AMP synthase n=1 Tax=Salinisphaera aquimarina TaxID=2094031 RepID=A0ABV7EL31_9GAMM